MRGKEKDLSVSSNPSTSVAQTALPTFPLDFGSIRSMVEYRFAVLDSYVDVNGLPTFTASLEPMKTKFVELLHDLANHNLTAKISKVSEKLVIQVFPKPRLGKPRTTINLALFLATLVTVSIASYFYTQGFFTDPRLAAVLFRSSDFWWQVLALAISIIGIVGIHETGHVIAARHHKMDATLPYFVPAPPPIGTFGAVISLRSPPGNRDQLFDLGFSGPLAGFLALIVVALFALASAPAITLEQANALFAAKLLTTVNWPNEPLLLETLGQTGLGTAPVGYVSVLTGVVFAVQIGALITFLNLLPVWQLDGGHITRATLGSHGHKITALAAFAILVIANYWGFAVLLLIFMFLSRRPLEGVEPLDDLSPLSASRKALFFLALVMLVLCFVIL
jgi:Zn-dependent protease